MSDKKNVSVSVSESVAFTLPRITIYGLVGGSIVYAAQKTGDKWEFNLSGQFNSDHAQMMAIQEAMAQVHEKMKSFDE